MSQRRSESGGEHPPPPRPHLRQRVPPRRDAGHRPRQVPRRGARCRPRSDQGDHRARLRRPDPAPAGAHLLRPDDAAPARSSRSSCATSAAGAHHQRRRSSGCPSSGSCSLATWRSPAVSRSCSRARSPVSAARSRRCASSRRRCWPPATARSAAATRSGGCWTPWTATSAYVAEVAADSYAAGLTPLEAAQKHRDNPYSAWAETERFVGNLHRAYSELAGNPLDTRLTVPSVWPDMVTFHGGPIACHA